LANSPSDPFTRRSTSPGAARSAIGIAPSVPMILDHFVQPCWQFVWHSQRIGNPSDAGIRVGISTKRCVGLFLTKFHNLSGAIVDDPPEGRRQNRVSTTNRFVDSNRTCRQIANETENGFVDKNVFCSIRIGNWVRRRKGFCRRARICRLADFLQTRAGLQTHPLFVDSPTIWRLA
jgi:hypothetical protein